VQKTLAFAVSSSSSAHPTPVKNVLAGDLARTSAAAATPLPTGAALPLATDAGCDPIAIFLAPDGTGCGASEAVSEAGGRRAAADEDVAESSFMMPPMSTRGGAPGRVLRK